MSKYDDGYIDGEIAGLSIARMFAESAMRKKLPYKKRIRYVLKSIDERIDLLDIGRKK